jgi:hypothetical protein
MIGVKRSAKPIALTCNKPWRLLYDIVQWNESGARQFNGRAKGWSSGFRQRMSDDLIAAAKRARIFADSKMISAEAREAFLELAGRWEAEAGKVAKEPPVSPASPKA